MSTIFLIVSFEFAFSPYIQHHLTITYYVLVCSESFFAQIVSLSSCVRFSCLFRCCHHYTSQSCFTLEFLAKISFTPLLYHPGGCLGCPEKWTNSRNYNLFVSPTVFQSKWYGIQKTNKNYKNPAKSYCCSILAGKQRPEPIRLNLS